MYLKEFPSRKIFCLNQAEKLFLWVFNMATVVKSKTLHQNPSWWTKCNFSVLILFLTLLHTPQNTHSQHLFLHCSYWFIFHTKKGAKFSVFITIFTFVFFVELVLITHSPPPKGRQRKLKQSSIPSFSQKKFLFLFFVVTRFISLDFALLHQKVQVFFFFF